MILTSGTADSSTPGTLLAAGLEQKKIPSLDGLRAVAVILVILNHLRISHVPDGRGVLTFFVLSGFLITWMLLKESERYGEISIANFYVRRVLRIFPAFYVFWSLSFLLLLASVRALTRPASADYFSAFFYLSNYRRALGHGAHHYMAHTWALSIEEQFYLLWPLVFMAFCKDLERFARVLICAIAAVDLYRAILFFRLHVPDRWLDVALDSRIDHILVGCLLAVLLKQGAFKQFWEFVSSRTWISVLNFALIISSIALNERYHLRYKYAVGFVVDPLLTAFLLVQVIALGNRWPWKWLNWSIVRYIGRVSYSVFLYHGFTNRAAVLLLKGSSKYAIAPVAIGFAIAAGSISYYLIELKFLKLKSRFERKRAEKIEKGASQALLAVG
jgi:peptidoglycan/LPS O-acetylase OafA/YrhL